MNQKKPKKKNSLKWANFRTKKERVSFSRLIFKEIKTLLIMFVKNPLCSLDNAPGIIDWEKINTVIIIANVK